MATSTKTPIGQLKCKATVHCTICGQTLTRNLKAYVYENTPEAIEGVKVDLKAKANKAYTCRICKSIAKDI